MIPRGIIVLFLFCNLAACRGYVSVEDVRKQIGQPPISAENIERVVDNTYHFPCIRTFDENPCLPIARKYCTKIGLKIRSMTFSREKLLSKPLVKFGPWYLFNGTKATSMAQFTCDEKGSPHFLKDQ